MINTVNVVTTYFEKHPGMVNGKREMHQYPNIPMEEKERLEETYHQLELDGDIELIDFSYTVNR